MLLASAHGQLSGDPVWPESALSRPCRWVHQCRVDRDPRVAAGEYELLELGSLGFHSRFATEQLKESRHGIVFSFVKRASPLGLEGYGGGLEITRGKV